MKENLKFKASPSYIDPGCFMQELIGVIFRISEIFSLLVFLRYSLT